MRLEIGETPDAQENNKKPIEIVEKLISGNSKTIIKIVRFVSKTQQKSKMRLSVSFWFADMQENITKNQNETFLDIIINKPYKELSIIISKKVSFWFFLVFS